MRQSARLFLNHMLATLRDCPDEDTLHLSVEFKKDLQWFRLYVASRNGVCIIDEDVLHTVDIFMDACTTDCGALCGVEAYHTIFQQRILDQRHGICELEALNVAVAIKLWALTLVGHKVRLYSYSSMAVAIIKAGKGRNRRIQACARYGCHVPCITSLSPAPTHQWTVLSVQQMLLAGVIWEVYIRIGYTCL